ncbi:MAG: peptidyl-alpha-hydroxyglycine alpha-amidating lyase family protein [Thermodesulfobacteriota bacterium]
MQFGSGTYQYELVEGWAKLPAGESFIDISSISIDRRDRVFIFNRSRHPMMVFDREGNLLTSWGAEYFTHAHGSCIGPDDAIYCTDDRNHTVAKFDDAGKVLMVLGTKNQPSDTGYRDVPDLFERISSITKGGAPFNRPTGVALSPAGEIYVADGYGNARVHKFSPDGKLLLSWGEPGAGPGQFRLPHSVFIDKRNRVWVTDRENSRIQIFSDKGKLLNQWTDLIRPQDLVIDDDDTVFISELCKRISIFTINGKLLARWGNERHDVRNPLFISPHAIALDSRGDLYVGEVSMSNAMKVDRGARTVQKFARKS